jgi:hypothetical protein
MFAEHSCVVLVKDLPDLGLTAGEIGAVVQVYQQGQGYEVEFVDGKGSTVALVTLPSDDIRSRGGDELLHTRKRN